MYRYMRSLVGVHPWGVGPPAKTKTSYEQVKWKTTYRPSCVQVALGSYSTLTESRLPSYTFGHHTNSHISLLGHHSKSHVVNQSLSNTRQLSSTIKRTMAQQLTVRQNYSEEAEAHVNKQINMELYASYVYMSMAYYFDREDVALPGFHKYFKKSSDEEREHAEKLMKYQNRRGGRIVLQPIAKPTRDEWSGPLEAITAALELEKTVNQTLLDLHGVSGRNNDPHLADFLETEYLDEQVKSIKELADHITNLNRVGKGLGEFTYDKELQSHS